MASPTLASRRFRVLADALIAEEGGVKARAGKRLGLSQPHFSMLARGVNNAEWSTCEAVARKLRLQLRYFTDPSLGEAPDYRDFLGSAPPEPPAPRDARAANATRMVESDPRGWLADMLEARGIVEPARRASVLSELDEAFGAEEPSPRFSRYVIDTWLVTEELRAQARASAP